MPDFSVGDKVRFADIKEHDLYGVGVIKASPLSYPILRGIIASVMSTLDSNLHPDTASQAA